MNLIDALVSMAPGQTPIRKGRVSRIIHVVNMPASYVVGEGSDAVSMPMIDGGPVPRVGDTVAWLDLPPTPVALGTLRLSDGSVVVDPSAAYFRSHFYRRPEGPSDTLAALGYTATAPVTRAQIDGILDAWVAATGGTTFNVFTTGDWTAAMGAARAGDLVRLQANLATALDARFTKYMAFGNNMNAAGLPGVPIILTCAAGVTNNVTVNNNFEGNLDVFNTDHVWVVGWNGIGSTFGIRCMNLDGTEAHPVRIAWNDIRDTGDAAIAFQGWFQLITTSGGTPPAGSGNEWGFSSYGVIEENTVLRPGRRNASTGEGVYLGYGSPPGFVARAHHVWVRYNRLRACTSDYVDVKPGCHDIWVHDNEESLGAFASGAANQILYVSQDLGARPGWYNFDPNVWFWGNRSWDGNISNPQGTSSDYFAQSSLAGVRLGFNLALGFANGGVGHHLRSERAASESQVAGEKWWTYNNLFWQLDGVINGGAPFASPTAFNSTWVDSRNNVGLTATTGVQFTATADDFVGASSIPAVSSVNPLPDMGQGVGSGFELAIGSDLRGVGASIADLAPYFSQDIFGRPITLAAPSAGPFQP